MLGGGEKGKIADPAILNTWHAGITRPGSNPSSDSHQSVAV